MYASDVCELNGLRCYWMVSRKTRRREREWIVDVWECSWVELNVKCGKYGRMASVETESIM